MSEHYFTDKPVTASNRKKISAEIRGITLHFFTDTSVFSRQAVDFGSRLLIETAELPAEGTVLDMGCGYGAIGLFAARQLKKGTVTMVDINERAVRLARDNAELNHLENVEVLHGNLFDDLGGRRFDCILTNPPVRAGKQVVHRILEQSAKHLTNGGKLWVVLQKKQGAPSARKKMEQCFRRVETRERSKGYYIFCASH